MLSRVADSIYWLNRYIERAENVARFLEVNLNLILDLPTRVQQQWQPLVATTGDKAFFEQHYGDATAENVIQFLTFDRQYPNSLISCLQRARENARSVREVISTEMWQQVNAFYLLVSNTAEDLALADLNQFLEEVRKASHLFAGVMDATITHNEGWHFGQMGRLLERADKTSRILDVKYFILLPSVEDVGTPIDELGWIALLKSTSAYEMYRKRSRRHLITPAEVADFLILDAEFPRSIRFCLIQVERSLHLISGSPIGTWHNPAERSIGRLRSELEYLTVEDIIEGGMHQFLDRLQKQMNQVDQEIFKTFLDLGPVHADAQRQSQL
ncbi:alpha-E domain-containing protein [Acaryochloris sp. IP29b_bin.137]|uniref:alpha-E domain-containing protein n=1 Tax=Acaryochloris sp. IP29b_bin.137 TaxID=2969217 RepID=UPI00260959FC|nr:alpha-E domain-containing protein [Acaryochloris sp. IP29b_bin.137]